MPIKETTYNCAVANSADLGAFAYQCLANKFAVRPSKPFADWYAEPNLFLDKISVGNI